MGNARTVRVRIAVAVDEKGKWFGYGSVNNTDSASAKWAESGFIRSDIYFLEATLPLPDATPTIAATVTKAEE